MMILVSSQRVRSSNVQSLTSSNVREMICGFLYVVVNVKSDNLKVGLLQVVSREKCGPGERVVQYE